MYKETLKFTKRFFTVSHSMGTEDELQAIQQQIYAGVAPVYCDRLDAKQNQKAGQEGLDWDSWDTFVDRGSNSLARQQFLILASELKQEVMNYGVTLADANELESYVIYKLQSYTYLFNEKNLYDWYSEGKRECENLLLLLRDPGIALNKKQSVIQEFFGKNPTERFKLCAGGVLDAVKDVVSELREEWSQKLMHLRRTILGQYARRFYNEIMPADGDAKWPFNFKKAGWEIHFVNFYLDYVASIYGLSQNSDSYVQDYNVAYKDLKLQEFGRWFKSELARDEQTIINSLIDQIIEHDLMPLIAALPETYNFHMCKPILAQIKNYLDSLSIDTDFLIENAFYIDNYNVETHEDGTFTKKSDQAIRSALRITLQNRLLSQGYLTNDVESKEVFFDEAFLSESPILKDSTYTWSDGTTAPWVQYLTNRVQHIGKEKAIDVSALVAALIEADKFLAHKRQKAYKPKHADTIARLEGSINELIENLVMFSYSDKQSEAMQAVTAALNTYHSWVYESEDSDVKTNSTFLTIGIIVGSIVVGLLFAAALTVCIDAIIQLAGKGPELFFAGFTDFFVSSFTSVLNPLIAGKGIAQITPMIIGASVGAGVGLLSSVIGTGYALSRPYGYRSAFGIFRDQDFYTGTVADAVSNVVDQLQHTQHADDVSPQ